MCGHRVHHRSALSKWIHQRKRSWMQARVARKLELNAEQAEQFRQLFDAAINMRHGSPGASRRALSDVLKLEGIDKAGLNNLLEQMMVEHKNRAEQVSEKFTLFYDQLSDDQRATVKSYVAHMQRHCAH